jgi:hypothetical protein
MAPERPRESCSLGKWIAVVVCTSLFFAAASFQTAFAAKKSEAINTEPDSNTAGILNTEVVPEKGLQADFVTGNVWYGISDKANLVVNLYAPARTLTAKPMLAAGGKVRYCETVKVSCSLTLIAAPGLELTGEKKRVLGALIQHGISVDFNSGGRFILGLGGAAYAERPASAAAAKYYDRASGWLNFLYDLSVNPQLSFGAGYSPVLKALDNEFANDNLIVTRFGFAGAGFFHLRSQYSVRDWQFGGGLGLLSAAGEWSLWPVLELNWRVPDDLFTDEEVTSEE